MEAAARTDIGRQREVNQDYICCKNDSVGILPNLYIVADGMGGHKAGDFASRFCVEEFKKEVSESAGRTFFGVMESALKLTNERLIATADSNPDYEGMGTTFVAATVSGDSVYVVNIGDSRLYKIEKMSGTMQQITQDHSLVEEMVRRGELDRRDARHHPKKNVITRALGSVEDARADLFEIKAEPGDYLVLCSDGLTNMLEDELICSTVLSEKYNLEEKAERLIVLANEQGGKDNISVVLVRI